MVATKAHPAFIDEQGTQLSRIRVEKVYVGHPLKSALKNLPKEEFTLDSVHFPKRSSTFHLSHEHCLPHYFHSQLFENICNRRKLVSRSQFTSVWVPATHMVLQQSWLCRLGKISWDIFPPKKRCHPELQKQSKKGNIYEENTIDVCWVH